MARRGGSSFGKGKMGGAGGVKRAIKRGSSANQGGRGKYSRAGTAGNVSGAATTGDGRARRLGK